MATRAEIMQALRAADAAGDTASAERLAKMYAAAPVDEPGLGDNFARAGQTLDDSMRLIVDTGSRGLVDKLLGPEQQALTEAARQRQGWGGTAVDVGSAVATSPYRVGSALVGAGAGAAEGAVSSYAHSDSWVPDPLQIGKDALIGGATGGFGAKVGEWAGGKKAVRDAKADQPYKTDAALRDAAEASEWDDALRGGKPSPKTTDLARRAETVETARAAQGEGRDAFARMRSGMSPDEIYKAQDIAAGPKSMMAKAGGVADKIGKEISVPLLLAEAFTMGGVPWKSMAGMGAKHLISKAGKSARATRVPEREIEDFAALARDPRGIGIRSDPLTVDAGRDLFSKLFAGYGRTP